MPDVKSVLSEEIRRLARKEVKAAVAPLQETVSTLKKVVAEQRRQLAALQKLVAPQQEAAEAEAAEAPAEEKKIRLNAAGIARLRRKLKLTQGELSALLDVSLSTISHWELGRCAPRAEQKRKLAELRHVGKRRLTAMLAEKCQAAESAAPETEANAEESAE